VEAALQRQRAFERFAVPARLLRLRRVQR